MPMQDELGRCIDVEPLDRTRRLLRTNERPFFVVERRNGNRFNTPPVTVRGYVDDDRVGLLRDESPNTREGKAAILKGVHAERIDLSGRMWTR